MKTAVFITMRPNRGATGGPGGVLYMIQKVLGNRAGKVRCKYIYQPIANRSFKGKRDKINRRFFQLYFLLHPHAYYITHDIYTGYLLAKMHRKYSLVFHQQGPIIQEKLNFGEEMSESTIAYWHKMEKMAFENAISVHFPSKGAEDMYFSNQYASCGRDSVKVGVPLYNAIPSEEPVPVEGLKKETDKLTFFSLGTLTDAKGQDQVVDVFETYLKRCSKPIRYIVVGRGPLQKEVIVRCKDLEKKYANFEFVYYEQLSHPEVMYIHSIADVYVMLHRISIFDFATLEAMVNNCAIVLSPIGGNMDFNKDDNVIFIDNAQNTDALLNADIETLKRKNMQVFDDYFSEEKFRQAYNELVIDYFSKSCKQ